MAAVSETLRTAVEFHRAGRLAEAESLYGEIVRIEPSHADALHLLGVAAHQRGDHRRAVDLIGRAIASKPGYAPFHGNLGAALRALGRIDQAIASCESAIQRDSQVPGFHFNLGNALVDREDFEHAARAYERAVALDPKSAESWNGLSISLARLERLPESIEASRRAIALRPRSAEQYLQLGNSLRGLGRSNEAAAEYLRAVSLRPDYLDAHVNLGAAYEDCGLMKAAVRAYDRALIMDPGSAPAHFNRALARLRSGDFARGWSEYEWRWKHNGRPRHFLQPEWNGETGTNSVLIYSEQGIGDEIQFASCVPDVIARAGNCVLECDPRLVRLFSRSFPTVRVIPRTGAGAAAPITPTEQFDAQIAIGSLPKLFRKSIAEFPKSAYLTPDSARVSEWKNRYRELGGTLTVGICWRGGKDPGVRRMRSTTLLQWKEVLQTAGVSFVNLQYGDCQAEIDSLQNELGVTLHDWNDANPLGDLDEFAARVAAVDLVIAVDNSTVHLAGSMGLEVWTLLPFASDWRWMLDRSDSPWYPNVRLFRQNSTCDWSPVFDAIAAELRKRLNRVTTDSEHSDVDTGAMLTETVALHQAGNLDEAERAYRRLVQIAPQDANVHHLLGVLCCQRGEHDSAIEYLARAIAIDGTAPVFHWNLALAYRAAKRDEQALAAFNRVIELGPQNADARIQKGLIHQSSGQLDPAIKCFSAAIAIDSINANSHNCLASALQASGRLSEAVAAYREAVRLRPDFGPFHFNLANALRESDRLYAALASYDEALRLVPDDAEALSNLGVLLREMRRFEESTLCCEQLMAARPDFAAARFNRSLVWLQQGRFAEGWDEYEWRWQHGSPQKVTTQAWDGSPLNGRSLLVRAEQGIGDEILFASCLPDIDPHNGRCIVECDPRLTAIFARSFPEVTVIAKSADTTSITTASADVEIPIGSLPRVYRRSIDSFPNRGNYLVANPQHLQEWHCRFDRLPRSLKVGISWRGGKEADVRRKRSTSLHAWKTILNVPGATFVNLQYGDCRKELDEAHDATGVAIHHWPDADPLRDIDFFAAQIAALDLVISVDNSTVHLAGALGTPVWTLLPFAADWRWLHERNDSPWYRSMHLFRQREPGNWNPVFDDIAAQLDDLTRNWPVPL